MSIESAYNAVEKGGSIETRFLDEAEKIQYEESAISLLHEYPDNFFPGHFEESFHSDYSEKMVCLALVDKVPIGCLLYDPETHECDWLAITKKIPLHKSEVAKTLFQTVFSSVPPGTNVFWYVNTEDAEFEGKLVGQHFERGRKLYAEMGCVFTRVIDKFGPGNHAYRVDYIT